jgi:hypothetical protein
VVGRRIASGKKRQQQPKNGAGHQLAIERGSAYSGWLGNEAKKKCKKNLVRPSQSSRSWGRGRQQQQQPKTTTERGKENLDRFQESEE